MCNMKDKSKRKPTGKSDKDKFSDNPFEDAQDKASKGQSQSLSEKEAKKSGDSENSKAKDELFRAREAEKEWSSESDEYRRDNA